MRDEFRGQSRDERELNATGSIVVAAEVATETVIDERAEVVKTVKNFKNLKKN